MRPRSCPLDGRDTVAGGTRPCTGCCRPRTSAASPGRRPGHSSHGVCGTAPIPCATHGARSPVADPHRTRSARAGRGARAARVPAGAAPDAHRRRDRPRRDDAALPRGQPRAGGAGAGHDHDDDRGPATAHQRRRAAPRPAAPVAVLPHRRHDHRVRDRHRLPRLARLDRVLLLPAPRARGRRPERPPRRDRRHDPEQRRVPRPGRPACGVRQRGRRPRRGGRPRADRPHRRLHGRLRHDGPARAARHARAPRPHDRARPPAGRGGDDRAPRPAAARHRRRPRPVGRDPHRGRVVRDRALALDRAPDARPGEPRGDARRHRRAQRAVPRRHVADLGGRCVAGDRRGARAARLGADGHPRADLRRAPVDRRAARPVADADHARRPPAAAALRARQPGRARPRPGPAPARARAGGDRRPDRPDEPPGDPRRAGGGRRPCEPQRRAAGDPVRRPRRVQGGQRHPRARRRRRRPARGLGAPSGARSGRATSWAATAATSCSSSPPPTGIPEAHTLGDPDRRRGPVRRRVGRRRHHDRHRRVPDRRRQPRGAADRGRPRDVPRQARRRGPGRARERCDARSTDATRRATPTRSQTRSRRPA